MLQGQQGGQSTRLPSAVFRSTAAKVSKELFYPEETVMGKLPGPGDYNAPEAHRCTNTDLINLAQPSSTFSNTQQDRWGRPVLLFRNEWKVSQLKETEDEHGLGLVPCATAPDLM